MNYLKIKLMSEGDSYEAAWLEKGWDAVVSNLLSEFTEERRQLYACGKLTQHGEGQVAAWSAAIRILEQ